MKTMLTMQTYSIHLAAITTVTLIPAMPCVPRFNSIVVNFFLIKPRIFRAFGAVVHIRRLVAFRQ